MSQEKEEYEVGIPLDDLTSPSVPPETDSQDDQQADNAAESAAEEINEEGSGLPSLFDEDELAEVGLKAAPFDEDEEISADVDDLDESDPQGEPKAETADSPETTQSTSPAEELASEQDGLKEMPGSLDEDLLPDQETQEDDAFVSENLLDEGLPIEELAKMQNEPETQPSDSVSLKHQLDTIQAQLDELKDEFAGKLKYDAHKDKIIDKLHQELQEYKQDIVKKHILSIVLDVVKVADDIRKWLAYFRSLDVSQRDPVKLFRYLEAIPSDLEDIFYWQGVKPYINREGPFNPTKQRAIKKVPTDDLSKDKTIAKSIRPGYEWENKVIRQEMVSVYVYEDEKESGDTRNIDE